MKINTIKQKIEGCQYLVDLSIKKVGDKHVKAAAEKVGLKTGIMKRAWTNFVQTGGKYVDKRCKYDSKNYKEQFAKPHEICNVTKERNITAKEAATILLRYMQERDTTSTALCNEYKITRVQFYRLINDINVTGNLLGKAILNPKKYAKVDVIDAIWLYKRPNTTRKSIRNLTPTEKLAYKRVGDVLIHYLSAI